MDLRDIYELCFKKWGLEAQTIMFSEELASAIKALSHLYRKYDEKNLAEFKDELVDAMIMIDEFKYKYQITEDEIERIKAFKYKRLEEKLSK